MPSSPASSVTSHKTQSFIRHVSENRCTRPLLHYYIYYYYYYYYWTVPGIIAVSISACHGGDRVSIPCRGGKFLGGRNSSVGKATRCGLNAPRIELRWGRGFRIRPDRPWGPPSLLRNGRRVSFRGVKRPGRGVNHPPPSSAEVKARVELCLYSPSGPSWPVLGRT